MQYIVDVSGWNGNHKHNVHISDKRSYVYVVLEQSFRFANENMVSSYKLGQVF